MSASPSITGRSATPIPRVWPSTGRISMFARQRSSIRHRRNTTTRSTSVCASSASDDPASTSGWKFIVSMRCWSAARWSTSTPIRLRANPRRCLIFCVARSRDSSIRRRANCVSRNLKKRPRQCHTGGPTAFMRAEQKNSGERRSVPTPVLRPAGNPSTQGTAMNFEFSDKVKELQKKVSAFMQEHVIPREGRFFEEIAENRARGNAWIPTRIVEELKPKARAAGLWNLWQPKDHGGTLTNLEYAPLCEIMGRSSWAPEVFNCSAPDTGNMEVLLRYGTPDQQKQWLIPLQNGEIRSAFLMTEPEVASSDATNIQCRIERQGNEYVINGRKWWSSGAGDPRCKIFILMGKSDPGNADRHKQQSMILVPADAKGVRVIR